MTNTVTRPLGADAETLDTTTAMRLLASCPDRPGIVAAVSRFLLDNGANIVRSNQYSTDPKAGAFFLRMEFALDADRRDGFAERFGLSVADRFDMSWRLWDVNARKRVAILASRYDHCLVDLLYRWQRDELDADIVLVASNHEDFRDLVEAVALPFHYIPVQKGRKAEAEQALLEVLDGKSDLVVLARYMQILSGPFLERVGVHHELPAAS